jgi:hypothetical protein
MRKADRRNGLLSLHVISNMMNRRNAVNLFMLLVLAGCSYQETVRHYTGVSIGSNDVPMDTTSPWKPLEATYHEIQSSGMLLTHFFQTGKRDTLVFQQIDSAIGWRWTNLPPNGKEINWWSDTSLGLADIHRSVDSLHITFGWGYGGESFYLKQDSEWVMPVHMKFQFFGLF